MKIFLALTCPHSRKWIRIYIFDFKKQKKPRKQETKKGKETEEENIFMEI